MTKEEKKEYDKNRYEASKEKRKTASKIYYKSNKEAINKRDRQYHKDNREKRNIKTKEWRDLNKEAIKKYRRKKYKERRKKDYLFKLKENIKRLIRQSFKAKNHKKNNHSVKIIGCTFEEFKIYIEKQFKPWMNWDNYGRYNKNKKTWQIDHIIPIDSAENLEDIIRLNHYTNLRPLDSKENLEKSNSLII